MPEPRQFRIEYPTGCAVLVTGQPRWGTLDGEPWPYIEAQAFSPPGEIVKLYPHRGGRVIDLDTGEVVWPQSTTQER